MTLSVEEALLFALFEVLLEVLLESPPLLTLVESLFKLPVLCSLELIPWSALIWGSWTFIEFWGFDEECIGDGATMPWPGGLAWMILAWRTAEAWVWVSLSTFWGFGLLSDFGIFFRDCPLRALLELDLEGPWLGAEIAWPATWLDGRIPPCVREADTPIFCIEAYLVVLGTWRPEPLGWLDLILSEEDMVLLPSGRSRWAILSGHISISAKCELLLEGFGMVLQTIGLLTLGVCDRMDFPAEDTGVVAVLLVCGAPPEPLILPSRPEGAEVDKLDGTRFLLASSLTDLEPLLPGFGIPVPLDGAGIPTQGPLGVVAALLLLDLDPPEEDLLVLEDPPLRLAIFDVFLPVPGLPCPLREVSVRSLRELLLDFLVARLEALLLTLADDDGARLGIEEDDPTLLPFSSSRAKDEEELAQESGSFFCPLLLLLDFLPPMRPLIASFGLLVAHGGARAPSGRDVGALAPEGARAGCPFGVGWTTPSSPLPFSGLPAWPPPLLPDLPLLPFPLSPLSLKNLNLSNIELAFLLPGAAVPVAWAREDDDGRGAVPVVAEAGPGAVDAGRRLVGGWGRGVGPPALRERPAGVGIPEPTLGDVERDELPWSRPLPALPETPPVTNTAQTRKSWWHHNRQTDRYFIDINKNLYRFTCHSDIYVHVYTISSLWSWKLLNCHFVTCQFSTS